MIDAKDEFAEDFACRARGPTRSTWTATAGQCAVPALIVRPSPTPPSPMARRLSPMGAPARATTRCVSRSGSRTWRLISGDRPGPGLRLDRGKVHRLRRRQRICRSTRASPARTRSTRTSGAGRETGFLEDIWTAPIEEVYASRQPRTPRGRRRGDDHLRHRGAVAIDGQKCLNAAGDPAHSTSGPCPGHRPDRHGGGPAGRHQESR